MELTNIVTTLGGYPLKNLRFISIDNIIVGQVLCPLFGKETLHDGYVSIQWSSKGIPIKKYKGMPDYSINLN